MKNQLQLVASKAKDKIDLTFKRADKEVIVKDCTKDELRMIKAVIDKVL